MIIKLYVHMCNGNVTMSLHNGDHDYIDDVIMSWNRTKFWTAETSLIFKLEGRVKARKVGEFNGYLKNIPKFR